MSRLVLLLATVVVCQYGTLGKAVYGDLLPDEHLEISDPLNPASRSMGPESSTLVKIRGVEAEHSAEPASLCYFIQESEIESQISCRLRFTRSKFNFNPFGLRYGKRDQGSGRSEEWRRDNVAASSLREQHTPAIPAASQTNQAGRVRAV
uniref:KISS2 n=1 Tax=Acipenser schrenckii TaxID=111304 RepID=A0A0S3J445_ACISC|nr:kisspeptin-2 [Acipenser schrenckii]AOW41583.1 KISS2 [Acipenser schrenckii]